MTLKRMTMKAATMMTMATVMTMTLAATALTACGSDDDDKKGSDPTTETEDAAEQARIHEEWQAEAMYGQLCMTDTTQGPEVLVSRIGKALYSVTPTVYYTIANTVDEARDSYMGIVGVASNDSIVTSMPDDVKRGDVHVSFAPSQADGEVARITVDCPRLANVVTSIIFLTEAAWPENDLAPPFNFLSLWQYLPNGNYYLTVRDSKGGMGLMLTFDSGWTVHNTINEGGGKWDIYNNETLACLDCYKCLSSCMLYYPDKFQSMMDAFASKGDTNSKTYQVLKRLWTDRANTYRAPQNERQFLYHNSCRKSGIFYVGVWYAVFNEKKLSLEQHEYSAMQLILATWPRGVPGHNAWFYSDYVRNESDWKVIMR